MVIWVLKPELLVVGLHVRGNVECWIVVILNSTWASPPSATMTSFFSHFLLAHGFHLLQVAEEETRLREHTFISALLLFPLLSHWHQQHAETEITKMNAK